MSPHGGSRPSGWRRDLSFFAIPNFGRERHGAIAFCANGWNRREGVAGTKPRIVALHQDIQDICSVGYTGVREDRLTPAVSTTDCTNSVLALL